MNWSRVRQLVDYVGEKQWLVCGLYFNEQQHWLQSTDRFGCCVGAMKATRGIEKEGNERALRHFELARNALEMRLKCA
jgi:hypothetical protein